MTKVNQEQIFSVIGTKFNRFTIISHIEKRKYLCKCDCGNERPVQLSALRRGASKSCGCYKVEKMSLHPRRKSHDMSKTPEYKTWLRIRRRCFNEKCDKYQYYGGRGISVCDRWNNSFECFYLDMGPRPSPKHSIERDDVNGNYEPSNCRWATTQEQHYNKRNTVYIDYNGFRKTCHDWSLETGMTVETLRQRVKKSWDVERIFNQTPRKQKRPTT